MIIHFIHHPVSAKKFVEPLVCCLNSNGYKTELWLENRHKFKNFVDALICPYQFAKFDISLNILTNLLNLYRLVKQLKIYTPQAIHSHQSRASFIPLLAAKILKIPVRIYHIHGAPYLGYSGFLKICLWMLDYLNCKMATHVISVSHSIRENIVKHKIVRGNKCEVLLKGSSCGIDLNEFDDILCDSKNNEKLRRKFNIPLSSYIAFYIGRPFKRKGFHTIINTWKILNSLGKDTYLIVAGCDENDVLNYTNGCSIKNIIALGYLTDLRPYYKLCDVVVLPSYHEGFPYSLLEGAAAARPLIGSNISGIDSIINDGLNGMLIPVGDEKFLAQSIIYLSENPNLGIKMGQQGRSYVEKYFNREITNNLFFNYYKKIGICSSNS